MNDTSSPYKSKVNGEILGLRPNGYKYNLKKKKIIYKMTKL